MKIRKLKNQSTKLLVAHLQISKDPFPFEEIYHRYYDNLFLYCLKITKDKESAYDITMDTFIQSIEKIHQLNIPEKFPSWLFRIAHNNCINYLINLQKNRFIPIEDCYHLAEDYSQKAGNIRKEALLIQMEISINKLDPIEKEILSEKYLNGKSLKDLEQKYSLSSSAVKMRLLRAKNKVVRLSKVSSH